MKNRIIKFLCLLIALVCVITFLTSIAAYAAHYDGSTEVVARIEVSTEPTQDVTDSSSAIIPDGDADVSTGYVISGCAVIAALLLLMSALVIYLCRQKNSKNSN